MRRDATFGDAILDRLVHHAHRITLTGGSLRKLGATSADAEPHAEKKLTDPVSAIAPTHAHAMIVAENGPDWVAGLTRNGWPD